MPPPERRKKILRIHGAPLGHGQQVLLQVGIQFHLADLPAFTEPVRTYGELLLLPVDIRPLQTQRLVAPGVGVVHQADVIRKLFAIFGNLDPRFANPIDFCHAHQCLEPRSCVLVDAGFAWAKP